MASKAGRPATWGVTRTQPMGARGGGGGIWGGVVPATIGPSVERPTSGTSLTAQCGSSIKVLSGDGFEVADGICKVTVTWPAGPGGRAALIAPLSGPPFTPSPECQSLPISLGGGGPRPGHPTLVSKHGATLGPLGPTERTSPWGARPGVAKSGSRQKRGQARHPRSPPTHTHTYYTLHVPGKPKSYKRWALPSRTTSSLLDIRSICSIAHLDCPGPAAPCPVWAGSAWDEGSPCLQYPWSAGPSARVSAGTLLGPASAHTRSAAFPGLPPPRLCTCPTLAQAWSL